MLKYILICTLLVSITLRWSDAGENICIEGFVMDTYCINLGVLFDNKDIETLQQPEVHSVHCLVDVPACLHSGYNIMVLRPGGDPKYGYAMKLDDTGNNKVLEVARREGICSTCTGGGRINRGFRAAVSGELVRSDDDDEPALLKVTNLTVSPKNFNISASDGCPGGATQNLNLTIITKSGQFRKPSMAHGSLMIIGWGFLLPTGISTAHFMKHRPNALWFKAHRIIQIVGLIVAITGWIIALATFDVFVGKGNSFNHGVLGMTVMVLGILQPFNAFIRPHPPKEGETKATKRLIWEIVHKGCGYIAALMATGTIAYGTFVIVVTPTAFRAAWGVSLAWIFIFTLACIYDKYRFSKSTQDSSVEMN